MSKDRSDFAVMNRMIDHIRLLIAVDDEQITVKKKLDVQAVLKEFQALLAVPEEQQERRRIATPPQGERDLGPHPLHVRLAEFAQRPDLGRGARSPRRSTETAAWPRRSGRRRR